MLLINRTHQRRRRRQDVIHENEDCLLGCELDSLADDVDELADGEVLSDGEVTSKLRRGRGIGGDATGRRGDGSREWGIQDEL